MKSTSKKLVIGTSLALLLATQSIWAENLNDLVNQKETLEQNASESQERKEALKANLEKLEGEITTLQNELNALENKITESNNEIKSKESSIQQLNTEIQTTIQIIETKTIELEQKKVKLKENIRLMYSRGEVGFIEFLFRAESVSQFLYRYQYMEDINNKGEALYNEVVEEIKFIESQKIKLEESKSKLENEKQSLVNQKNLLVEQEKQQLEVSEQLHEKHEEIEGNILAEEKIMQTLAAAIVQAEKEIVNEKARLEEERKKAEERKRKEEEERKKKEAAGETVAPAPSFGNGSLGRPMASGTYTLTSSYGYRIHPVTGDRKFHNGVDFGAPRNTPIYAAEEGFVLFSGPASGYGNWIVIKHPNGLYTIYGHMYSDSLYVSPGEYVYKGQKIAGVGSAGTSTGNHLHFCVATSFNGSSFTYANPMGYIN